MAYEVLIRARNSRDVLRLLLDASRPSPPRIAPPRVSRPHRETRGRTRYGRAPRRMEPAYVPAETIETMHSAEDEPDLQQVVKDVTEAQAKLEKPKRRSRGSMSSGPPPPDDDGEGPSEPPPDPPPEPAAADAELEKPKRKPRAPKEVVRLYSSSELDILWSPGEDAGGRLSSASRQQNLPPPEIFQEALDNLNIALHPSVQYRAIYPDAREPAPPVEPTVALYCPIEGGDYIVDETVYELASRTGSDVVVVDAAQVAAGQWGHFSNVPNSPRLPVNPLRRSSKPAADEGDEDDDSSSQFMEDDGPASFRPRVTTVGVIVPQNPFSGHILVRQPPEPPPRQMEAFFDDVINITSSDPEKSAAALRRPRIVYIRDFPTLAPSTSHWYPSLVSAVKKRRKGSSSSKASASTIIPTAIVCGITPSAALHAPSAPRPSKSASESSRSTSSADGKHAENADKEAKAAETARERRLRERLRKWETGDYSLRDELPALILDEKSREEPRSLQQLLDRMPDQSQESEDGSPAEDERSSQFFRTSLLVPSVRVLERERLCRRARLRELNELTMRMGIGAVGGVLSKRSDEEWIFEEQDADETGEQDGESDFQKMWAAWGESLEVWRSVRQIADRALGSVLADPSNRGSSPADPTPVPWSALVGAWAAQQQQHDTRKKWSKHISSAGKVAREETQQDGKAAPEPSEAEQDADELVEKVKKEASNHRHESRLVNNIISPALMPTSFSQVHLPPDTIDSIRTIVSLPLINPAEFQQGILAEHGIRGCLLFGPPGTGKTLLVRALAKEAGCRMLSIAPSDVVDLYVGESEKLVKAVFSLARKLSPCVVFLDEIDSLLASRNSAREGNGASIAYRGLITEFMQEMDGLTTSKNDRVIIIGATNRPFDLDDAVLRRLPRRLLIDLPGEPERLAILKILLRNETLSPDLDLSDLAKRTETFSGSDLKHLCVAAALDAVKERVEVPWKAKPATDAESPVTSPSDASNESSPEERSESQHPESMSSSISNASSPTPGRLESPDSETMPSGPRILALRHFDKALKEITPSASEALGTLADLRKWNEEFGEGGRNKRRQRVWGRGKFGFVDSPSLAGGEAEEGRVAQPAALAETVTWSSNIKHGTGTQDVEQ